ncbi:MAG: DNA polymerase III subunit chi [Hoeflea sp.]|uniref:DNA polymerase III subunit chi n=1 Tax=Hoeflea sp. TaxID=1940281 RepID=UPI002731E57D|nr:DNA polymerase III subunit chi [Hoeflea sp.]MDP2121802.1 DNA polymerase III subunit chi [Hoeflea sp.]MDP3525176.1 DNA polymerase III subunit chi [Hoeflea sp.]
MAEILFYHLTESRLEEALPPLLEKSLERGWLVSVHVGSEERCAALDSHLWTFREDSFLPHGIAPGPHSARQPVLLTVGGEADNGATVRFVTDGAAIPALDGVDRLVMMFDGHDQLQLEAARAQWKTLKSGGHALTYWQQTPDRRWEKKA